MQSQLFRLLFSCFCLCFCQGASAIASYTVDTKTTDSVPLAKPIAVPATQKPAVLSQRTLIDYMTENHWNMETIGSALGTPIKQIDAYEYYPAGVRIRQDDNTAIFAIIVDRLYQGEIVQGLTTKTTKQDVIKVLGNPPLIDQSNDFIGYQYDHYYLFAAFAHGNLKEFSLYRRDLATDVNELVNAAKHLQTYADKFSFPMDNRNFSIFSTWGNPEFTYHLHGIGSYEWEYPSLGIAYDGSPEKPKLTIYRNFSAAPALAELKKVKNISFSTDDSIFLKEQARIATEKEKIKAAKESGIISPDKQTIALIDADGLYSSANIRFFDANYVPVAQVYPGYFVDQVVWLDNRWVAYFTMEGMGVFNISSKENITLLNREQKPGTPLTIDDVNSLRADVKNHTLILELTDGKTLLVRYELDGDRFRYSW